MKLPELRMKQKIARDLIMKALEDCTGPGPFSDTPPFAEDRVTADEVHEKLTKEGIDNGIEALTLINNMSCASDPAYDLCKLLHGYLLNKDMRKQINSIIKHPR